jgi:NADPH-dependent curcumin reductase CurA
MPSSTEKIKSLKTVRGKDVKIRYTQDDFEDALVNQSGL